MYVAEETNGKQTERQHYNDVIMCAIASQITSLTIVYSIVYSDADQREHQSSESLGFVGEFTGDRWIPRTNGQLRGKCFHLMTSSWLFIHLAVRRLMVCSNSVRSPEATRPYIKSLAPNNVYGDQEIHQHWFRLWLAAWRHQAITRTNDDLSSIKTCDIHMRAISQEMLEIALIKIYCKLHIQICHHLSQGSMG